MSGHPVEVVLNLEDLGLVHAPGSQCDLEKCKADGGHRAEILVDLDGSGLHREDDCDHDDCWFEAASSETGPGSAKRRALQEAHEQMHPRGTVYVENCWEPACRHLLGAA
jgi:hypothetical protein